MSMVIIGGHDRMIRQYKQICKEHQCKVKVFTQMSANMREQIGSPDVIVLFTNTVSHKMVRVAVSEARRCQYYPMSHQQQQCIAGNLRKYRKSQRSIGSNIKHI